MHLPHHRSILETTTQRGYGDQRGSSTIQSEAYHGENANLDMPRRFLTY